MKIKNISVPAITETTLVKVVLGTLLLTLSAKIQVPLWPVNMNFQTVAVLMLGFFYGPKIGMMTVLAYLAEGAVGLPVFTGTPEKGIGLPYMMGPTGGYLLGFVGAAGFMGWCQQRHLFKNFSLSVMFTFFGMMILYVPGVLWLSHFMGMKNAFYHGAVVFGLAEAFKLLLCASVFYLREKAKSDGSL